MTSPANRTRPKVAWTKCTDGWASWTADHAGHRLTVTRWAAGSWGWHVYRLKPPDPDGRRWIDGPPVASGRTYDYRAGQRYAVDALLEQVGAAGHPGGDGHPCPGRVTVEGRIRPGAPGAGSP